MLSIAKNYYGKILLVRADLNMPIKQPIISDTTRLERFLPSLKTWQAGSASKIVVMSHLGRPNGKKNANDSLKPIAEKMADELKQQVVFLPDVVGDDIVKTIKHSTAKIFLGENLRFHAGEETNDANFAKSLSDNGDIYINDAFSISHRKHASLCAITKFLPSFAGPSLMAEVTALEKIFVAPKKPVMAIVGGAKISSKIAILEFLLPRLDHLVIAGAMANTFLKANNIAIGASLVEDSHILTAQKIIQSAKTHHCHIHLPQDVVVADRLASDAISKTKNLTTSIDHHEMILDIGDATIAHISNIIGNSKTILWNGPLGAFETTPFDKGTIAIAKKIASLTKQNKIISIAGGGDTAAALHHAKVANDFSYLSTAGGAFLEWLEGKKLPAIVALENNKEFF
ncbi:MAG: phosphoglycerate kinase [Alphaproteobacteria bacterium]